MEKNREKVRIYNACPWDGRWDEAMKKEARPLDSVVLDIDDDGKSLSEEIK